MRCNGVLCVGAHPDDLALSVGGLVLRWRSVTPIFCVVVFGASTWAIPSYRVALESLDAVRTREENRWRRLVGVAGCVLGLPDTSRRGVPIERECTLLEDASLWRDRARAVIARVSERVRPALTLAPMAIGGHADHVAVRDACLNLGSMLGAIALYEDLPYAHERPDIGRLAQDVGHGRPHAVGIGRTLARKLALLSCYPSQLSAAHRDAVRRHALSLAAGEPVERLWLAGYPLRSRNASRVHGRDALPP